MSEIKAHSKSRDNVDNGNRPFLPSVSYKFSLLLELWSKTTEPAQFHQSLCQFQKALKGLKPLMELPLESRFQEFNRVFFDHWDWAECFLPPLLPFPSNSPACLSWLQLLYSELAHSLQLKHSFIKGGRQGLMKFDWNGQSLLMDFKALGKVLDSQEILGLVNQNIDFRKVDHGLYHLSQTFDQLKGHWTREKRYDDLRVLNLVMMKTEPFNLVHIKERARLAYRAGDYRAAVEDIRNYFSYKSPEIRSLSLIGLYRKALRRSRKASDRASFKSPFPVDPGNTL